MIRKCICILLVFEMVFGISGCRKKENPELYEVYTRAEVLTIFNNNRNLFDELVAAIMDDTSFLEKGNVEPDGSTGVTLYDDRYMDLYNERSQKAIREVLEFKPYMVEYIFRTQAPNIISVIFIGDGSCDETFGFDYLIDQSNSTEMTEYINYLKQTYYVEQLSNGWIFHAKVFA